MSIIDVIRRIMGIELKSGSASVFSLVNGDIARVSLGANQTINNSERVNFDTVETDPGNNIVNLDSATFAYKTPGPGVYIVQLDMLWIGLPGGQGAAAIITTDDQAAPNGGTDAQYKEVTGIGSDITASLTYIDSLSEGTFLQPRAEVVGGGSEDIRGNSDETNMTVTRLSR